MPPAEHPRISLCNHGCRVNLNLTSIPRTHKRCMPQCLNCCCLLQQEQEDLEGKEGRQEEGVSASLVSLIFVCIVYVYVVSDCLI